MAHRHRLRDHQPEHRSGCPGSARCLDTRHWQIGVLHHIRTGSGPQATASLRNLSIGILKMAGHPSIAAACRHHARDATQTMATLGLSPP